MSMSSLDGTSVPPHIHFEERTVRELLASLGIDPSYLETTESLSSILVSPRHRESILSLKEEQARCMLDLLQFVSQLHLFLPSNRLICLLQVVDNAIPQALIFAGRKMLINLSRKSGELPDCFTIQGVARTGDGPVVSGGFGDVWKGNVQPVPFVMILNRCFSQGYIIASR
jgi:hypothetical protein